MSQNGWVKLHRSLLEHWTNEDPRILQLFIHCLLRANHAEAKVLINGDLFQCTIGSFITSKHKLAKELKVSRKTLDRLLKPLINDTMLDVKTHQSCTMITICNYKKYQGYDEVPRTIHDTPNAPQRVQPMHNESAMMGTTDAHKQEELIITNKKEEEKEIPVDPFVQDVFEAKEHLEEPTGNEPWEKTNDFINSGRRPMKRYPSIMISAGELANVFQVYDEALPGENWRPAFLHCEAEINKQIAKGQKSAFISAFTYLTTFCLEAAMRRKNESVKIQKNSERGNYVQRQ